MRVGQEASVMLELLRLWNASNAWANEGLAITIAAARDLEAVKLPVLRHLLVSEAMRLACQKGRDSSTAVWDPTSLEDHLEFARELSASDQGRTIDYHNTQGIVSQNTVHELLMHMPLHSARHPGEVAAALGDHGLEAPESDLNG